MTPIFDFYCLLIFNIHAYICIYIYLYISVSHNLPTKLVHFESDSRYYQNYAGYSFSQLPRKNNKDFIFF